MLRSFKDSFHLFHSSFSSEGSGSSFFPAESLQGRAPPCMVIGATNPIASYKQFTVPRTLLFTYGFSSLDTWSVKLSVSRFHRNPKLHCRGRSSNPRSKSFKSVALFVGKFRPLFNLFQQCIFYHLW